MAFLFLAWELLFSTGDRTMRRERREVTSMRKFSRLGSLVAMGVVLISLTASVVRAATPGAVDQYQQAVEQVMRWDGEILPSDRALLDAKRSQLGLTPQEAKSTEDLVRTHVTTEIG
jgi:hypothetical protein